MIFVAVQPRPQKLTSTLGPLVVTTAQTIETTVSSFLFASAILLDCNGNGLESGLEGVNSATGISLLDDTDCTGEGTRDLLFFVFSTLKLSRPGKFYIRVDVYNLDYAGLSGATLMEQTTTSLIVFDEEVSIENYGEQFITCIHDFNVH